MLKEKKTIYEKKFSFEDFYSSMKTSVFSQINRSIKIIKKELLNKEKKNIYFYNILQKVLTDLLKQQKNIKSDLKINRFIADEIARIDDKNISRYFFNRYRYDVFPIENRIDDYPPYVQIELSSRCNYRCVFCYQPIFSKHKEMMGMMNFDTYKSIVEQIEGHVEFISLASRGEPLLCKDIEKILQYNIEKFLCVKLNTNAYFLREHFIHAILTGGINTLVFSVDTTDEKEYAQMRINGNLKKVKKNIEMFYNIKQKYYPDSKIITRISGVKINESQDIKSMISFWKSLVDQIVFVKYMPWEDVYNSKSNNITLPCSELWKRIFIWYNGKTNPCESDFLSTFSMGNIRNKSISKIWKSPKYQKLRNQHLLGNRNLIFPCQNCIFV